VEVELGDDGDHRGQVGLVLGVDDGIDQTHLAVRTAVPGDLDDPIHMPRDGACGPLVALGPPGLLGVGLVLAAAEGGGLTLAGLLGVLELLAEGLPLPFQLGNKRAFVHPSVNMYEE
jgi:hypothetical protein